MKYVLDRIKFKNVPEARALLIVLYYSGCRPIEALKLRQKNFFREINTVTINMPSSKRGRTRPIPISLRKCPLMKEAYEYACAHMPDTLIFYDFFQNGGNGYARTYTSKAGQLKVRYEHTDKIRHCVKKWFSVLDRGTIPPYFLRHNRFSHMSAHDATLEEIQFIKGAKTLASVLPYVHMSSGKAKKIRKKIF